MHLFVSGGTRTVNRLIGHPNLGVLLTPAAANNPPPKGVLFAADNSAFSSFDDYAYRAMLKKLRDRPDCQWVTAPDVVGNHNATLELWEKWIGTILEHGQMGAFVAQDGCTVESLPWARGMAAVFIGGTTRWKLGTEVARIVHQARRCNLPAHMGRVNTFSRLLYAAAIGCTSVDGSKYSRWSETYIPQALEYLANLDRQRMVPLEAPW